MGGQNTRNQRDNPNSSPSEHIEVVSAPNARPGSPGYQPPRTLQSFRELEGRQERKRRLQELWHQLSEPPPGKAERSRTCSRGVVCEGLTDERAAELRLAYDKELMGRCGVYPSAQVGSIGWQEFKDYAVAKEVELWAVFHDELDLDGNGQLDEQELKMALSKAGVTLSAKTLAEFMATLSSSPHSGTISFADFRDFLLLLPRRASPAEIYQYYELRKYLGDDGRGPARVTMEGDVSLSAEDRPPKNLFHQCSPEASSSSHSRPWSHHESHEEGEDESENEHHRHIERHTALKFLLAGGIAGAVSRTCTAPFDRLKVFLITRPPDLGGALMSPTAGMDGIRTIMNACARIYAEGGFLGFWTGNGLSVAKIFPESAIKFYSYESSKRAFARYFDHVDDVRDISGVSRFLSGGIGGITSQLSIYPIETLKTQMMSNSNQQKQTLVEAARHLWSLGGPRAYYRGLMIGLLGVFPYSAIDMSTFEALKLTYVKSTGREEPGVMALLAFGSISGSVGATSVYPLNLVRTRLQASGSSGHPQRYTGVWDVAVKTWESGGWRAFYRGLAPTLAKVIPSVSITYVVYEHSKRKLGV